MVIVKLKQEEERRLTGHSGTEAQGTVISGILSYKKINGTYQDYLAKEVEKDKSK